MLVPPAQEGRVLPAFYLIQFLLKFCSVKFGDNQLTVSLRKNEGQENAVVQELEVIVSEIK